MSLKVAVVGAGPSGLYAAEALAGERDVEIDIFDRLPVPMGLVRYGVAPDHFSIRSVRDTLDKVFDHPNVRFRGGIDIGRDIDLAQLRKAYHAVILTYGASSDRALGIAGEQLPGSIAATDFVGWYTGHPDHDPEEFGDFLRNAHSVAVVGVGNVAVDVTRILMKDSNELEATDMPAHVLKALSESTITDVHLCGRRGPVQASYTTKELKELGELEGVGIQVDAQDLALDPHSQQQLATNKVAARNFDVLKEWAERPARADARNIHLHFFAKPVEIHGDTRVESLTIQRTRLDDEGRLHDVAGETSSINVDGVIRSVGYRGLPIGDIPFDHDLGIVRNVEGRVEGMPGVYVAGWIKRGPSGIIGTNKKDASATVARLMEDAPQLAAPTLDSVVLVEGFAHVDVNGWRAIDAEERRRGASASKARVTVHSSDELRAIAAT